MLCKSHNEKNSLFSTLRRNLSLDIAEAKIKLMNGIF